MIVVDASAFLSVVLGEPSGEPSGDSVLRTLLGDDSPATGRGVSRLVERGAAASHEEGARRRAGERKGDREGSREESREESREGSNQGNALEHGTLIAPEFLVLEVANTVLQLRRRARRAGVDVNPASILGVEPGRVARAVRAHFDELRVTLESFSSHDDFDRTLQIAERCGIASYDALYVAFAERRGARLLTLDRSMAAAAATVGVPTLPAAISSAHSDTN